MRRRLLSVPADQLDEALLAVNTFVALRFSSPQISADAFDQAMQIAKTENITQISVTRALAPEADGSNTPLLIVFGEDRRGVQRLAGRLTRFSRGQYDLPAQMRLTLARRRLGLVMQAEDEGDTRLEHRAHYGEQGRRFGGDAS